MIVSCLLTVEPAVANNRKTRTKISALMMAVEEQQRNALLDVANKFGIKQLMSKR